MLALTRKVGEKLIIDDNIILTIVEIKGDNIRVAIDAPKKIKIYRGEIYDAIVNENKMAAASRGLDGLDTLKEVQIKKFKNIKET